MKEYTFRDHLKEMLKDPYFKELYELDQQKFEVVKKIIAYRIKHKLNQKQLAKQIGVTQQHISKIENGEFSSVSTLEKVLLGIGYSVRIQVVPLSVKMKNRLNKIFSKNY
jgi:transcriptional regulator with XRE-family HTH domain